MAASDPRAHWPQQKGKDLGLPGNSFALFSQGIHFSNSSGSRR